MPKATFTFPKGFLWGSATAAHQVEGFNSNNDWWAWEQIEGNIHAGDKSGRACDWWAGRWREDFDRAHETYQNAHRLSVEWSRIQPEPDRWDESALDRYRQMLIGLHERDMTAMVTLHHFTNPLWLADMGGWENPETPELFAAYVEKTVDALIAHCSLWVTINEPNVYMAGGYLGGGFPPGKNDLKLALQVLANMVRGHAAAYQVIHKLQPDAQVGIALNYRSFKPASWSPLDKLVTNLHHKIFNQSFPQALVDGNFDAVLLKESIPQAAGTQDYFGVNYYSRDLLRFSLLKSKEAFTSRSYPKGAELSETGFLANIPEGLYEGIKWARQFDLPIYITENGCEDSMDDYRRRYTLLHIHQMWRIMQHNAPVKGYFHWSLVDNFEWERGWSQRFGLWGLNSETQARIRRPSVDMYAAICKANALDTDVIEQYAPEIFERILPV